MAMNTQQAVQGRIATEPELTNTANGSQRLAFRLAMPTYEEDMDGAFVETEPQFVTVEMWGKSAVRTSNTIRNGDAIVALGRVREYEFTTDEGQRTGEVFRAARVGLDLNLTRVTVQRRTEPPATPARTAGAEVDTGGAYRWAQTADHAPALGD